MANNYIISFEVEGPAAIFTRPDSGSTPISYPVPTYSAAKGMFDAVLRWPHIYVHPTHVEICRPIRYERYVTNYGGPLRKSDQIRNKNNYQLIATILVDVCYRIYGEAQVKRSTRGNGRKQLKRRSGCGDCAAEFQRMFNERLENGQTFYTPCLGWKEFVPTYFGKLREQSARIYEVEECIPALLHSMWEQHEISPKFVQDWKICGGMMSYQYREPQETYHA